MDHRTLTGTTASLYRFSIPLTTVLNLRGESLSERRGLVLVLRDAEGREGFGEAAPLPGFSAESIDQVVQWLKEWCGGLPQKARLAAPKSALYAISQAMVDIKSAATGWKPHRILSGQASSVVHVNAVILRGEDLRQQIERVEASGFRAVKLKVGGDVDEAANYVNEALDLLRPTISVRLDANRAWSYNDATRFARQIPKERIEYIEEPLAEPEHLAEFAGSSNLPIALDESLLEWPRKQLADATFAHAFIVKPMMIGGAGEVWTVIQQAVRARAKVVFSGAFESDLGQRHLLAMAGAWAPGICHGMDTARFLAHGLLENPGTATGARIRLADALSEHPRIDYSRLEQIF
jgi:o-succinylbenzoate synthase